MYGIERKSSMHDYESETDYERRVLLTCFPSLDPLSDAMGNKLKLRPNGQDFMVSQYDPTYGDNHTTVELYECQHCFAFVGNHTAHAKTHEVPSS